MINNHKKHKEVKFNKVSTQTFKSLKRFSINKSPNDLILINAYHSPIHKKDKKGKRYSINSYALENLLKFVEDKYSPKENKLLFKEPKKMHSTNKINSIKFKSNLRKKLLQKKEEEKNEQIKELRYHINLGQKNVQPKKYTSSNNINFCKSFLFNNLNNKNHNNSNKKKRTVINNENEKITNYISNNNINKEKKEKKKKKKNKEEKKNNDITTTDKEKLNNIINSKKKSFFCCL